jgi:hypothetical protein
VGTNFPSGWNVVGNALVLGLERKLASASFPSWQNVVVDNAFVLG